MCGYRFHVTLIGLLGLQDVVPLQSSEPNVSLFDSRVLREFIVPARSARKYSGEGG